MTQRVPTLPTPTTLRASVDEAVPLEEVAPVLGQRRPVVVKTFCERPLPGPQRDVRDRRADRRG